MNQIIAIDADGVLLNYSDHYANGWERAFGVRPREVDPLAYWPMDRWGVEQLSGPRLEQLRAAFDENFWSTLPAMPGALEACQALSAKGYELVCVTALPDRFARCREQNLKALGFPLSEVFLTGNDASVRSPKASVLERLSAVAFVDDFAPYFLGIPERVHGALISGMPNGAPNSDAAVDRINSTHADLPAFASWWLARR